MYKSYNEFHQVDRNKITKQAGVRHTLTYESGCWRLKRLSGNYYETLPIELRSPGSRKIHSYSQHAVLRNNIEFRKKSTCIGNDLEKRRVVVR